MLIIMAILMKLATCHVRNAFKRPIRPNAPMARVLTSVILKGIGWAFRKLYPTKIPGMVHQGLLAPQRLEVLPQSSRLHSEYGSTLGNNVIYKLKKKTTLFTLLFVCFSP